MRSRRDLIRELSEDLPPAPRLRGPLQLALLWWIGAWTFVVGATLGAMADRIGFLSPIAGLEVTPEAVFFVFLPTLIFQSAFHLDARALRENLAPTLTLAVPGLLISTALIGAIMHTAAPTMGGHLSWPESLLLGSILSATDPVAVIALFSQLGAPKRLTVLVPDFIVALPRDAFDEEELEWRREERAVVSAGLPGAEPGKRRGSHAEPRYPLAF